MVLPTHGVFDTGGDTIGEVIEIFILPFPGKGHQGPDQVTQFVDFLETAATAFAVGSLLTAFSRTGSEVHKNLRSVDQQMQLKTPFRPRTWPESIKMPVIMTLFLNLTSVNNAGESKE
jgi:hypothetical protein